MKSGSQWQYIFDLTLSLKKLKMKKTVCLLLIFQILQSTKLSSFDPLTFDYCSIPCDREAHSACKCNEKETKNTVTSDKDITLFRRLILEYHNKLRNKIASGDEEDCPKAANMMVLNYDIELEHIAKCHSKAMPPVSHDICRKKHDHGRNPGQNIYTSGVSEVSVKDFKDIVGKGVTAWYNEVHIVENKEELLKNFGIGSGYMHFTAVVWAKVTHVGCVMVHVTGSSNVILCNYAYDSDSGGGNLLGEPVYEFGDPCSKCPNEEKCNGNFPALCGTIEGTDMVLKKGNEKNNNKDEKKDEKNKNQTSPTVPIGQQSNDTVKSKASFFIHFDINLLFIGIFSIILPNLL